MSIIMIFHGRLGKGYGIFCVSSEQLVCPYLVWLMLTVRQEVY